MDCGRLQLSVRSNTYPQSPTVIFYELKLIVKTLPWAGPVHSAIFPIGWDQFHT